MTLSTFFSHSTAIVYLLISHSTHGAGKIFNSWILPPSVVLIWVPQNQTLAQGFEWNELTWEVRETQVGKWMVMLGRGGSWGKVLVTLADWGYQTHHPYWSLNSYLAGLFWRLKYAKPVTEDLAHDDHLSLLILQQNSERITFSWSFWSWTLSWRQNYCVILGKWEKNFVFFLFPESVVQIEDLQFCLY